MAVFSFLLSTWIACYELTRGVGYDKIPLDLEE